MKFHLIVALFAGLAASRSLGLVARQLGNDSPYTSDPTEPPSGYDAEPCDPKTDCNYSYLIMNMLKEGPCKKVTWIFARASTEDGNMV
jgi:hypothetical protein